MPRVVVAKANSRLLVWDRWVVKRVRQGAGAVTAGVVDIWIWVVWRVPCVVC